MASFALPNVAEPRCLVWVIFRPGRSCEVRCGAAADRGGQAARAILRRGDRARRASNRLSRSGADAPRLHPRLRPAAAIAAPRSAGGLGPTWREVRKVPTGDIDTRGKT